MWQDVRRRILVEGESKRSVKKLYGLHWSTLEKILAEPEPPGYRLTKPRRRRKLEAFEPVIEEILRRDREAPAKQRHTTQRIIRRLRDEHGYTGGDTAVKDLVREFRRREQEVFVPLVHPPGEAQADFGHAEVVVEGRRAKAALFVMTLPFSDAFFCRLYPRECTETFLDGHRRAFEFFGGVPRRISYDNTRTAVTRIIGRRERELTREFLRLKAHYLFDHHFCLVRRPNEKGHVENTVGYARRNFLVPVPVVGSLEALNADLERLCREDLGRRLGGKDGTKAELLEKERPSLLPLPARAFEARRIAHPRANSLSLVRFDGNDYSVPVAAAHRVVTLVAGAERVKLVADGRLVAEHRREWEKRRVSFEPLHYLALLERKPGAFDFARPLADWKLPECFGVLRRRLEGEAGGDDGEGTREFIKVLRLLESASVEELAAAVEKALSFGAADADAVRLVLEHRRERPVTLFRLDGRPHLSAVQVAKPDLAAYRSLTALGAAGGGQ
jgi:transposase